MLIHQIVNNNVCPDKLKLKLRGSLQCLRFVCIHVGVCELVLRLLPVF